MAACKRCKGYHPYLDMFREKKTSYMTEFEMLSAQQESYACDKNAKRKKKDRNV